MKLRYLARIKLAQVPRHLMPLSGATIGLLLDTAGWAVTHQEVRDYGAEYWVTLEREIQPPRPLHTCCTVDSLPGARGRA